MFKTNYSVMENTKKSEKVTYEGKVVGKPLVIGTKKPKTIKVGGTFKTDNQSVYQSLINNKRIV